MPTTQVFWTEVSLSADTETRLREKANGQAVKARLSKRKAPLERHEAWVCALGHTRHWAMDTR